MKKLIYGLGLVMVLGSASFVIAEDEDVVKSEKRIGNVAVYERIITISAEKCLKKVSIINSIGKISCYVEFPQSDEDLKGIEGMGMYNYVVMDIPLEKNDGKIAYISLQIGQNGYQVSIYPNGPDSESVRKLLSVTPTKEIFSDLLSKFLKEKGTEFPVRFIKIEK